MIQKINKPIAKVDLQSYLWGFDIETYNLTSYKKAVDPFDSDTIVCTISLCNGRSTYGWVIEHPELKTSGHKWIDEIWKVLGDSKNTLSGHCVVEFDAVFCERYFNRSIKCEFFDTLVACSLINENTERNTLDNVAKELLNKSKKEIDASCLGNIPVDKVIEYNMYDAELSYELYAALNEKLADEGQTFIADVSMDVLKVLKNMMTLGTAQDPAWLRRGLKNSEKEFKSVEKNLRWLIKNKAPEDINFNSPKQLAELLFEKLDLPVLERTPSGAAATGKDTLIQLQFEYVTDENGKSIRLYPFGRDVVKELVKYRKVKKLISTYLTPLLTTHNHDDRVYAKFHMGRKQFGKYDVSGTRTGRLSSSNPNLQNQPRTEIIRGSFVPTPGYKMFAADYRQLELRIAAWYSQDKVMLNAFEQGLDIHTLTLANITGIDYNDCMKRLEDGDKELKEKRVIAKNTNFLILYGGGPWRLCKTARVAGANLSNSEAKRIISKWKAGFPDLARTLRSWENLIRHLSFSTTPTGRKRRFSYVDTRAVRQGINFRIQSFASDITLIAMMLLDKKFNGSYILNSRKQSNGRLLLQVHDEIVGEYKGMSHTEIKKYVTDCMVKGVNNFLDTNINLAHPLPLDIDIETDMKRWS